MPVVTPDDLEELASPTQASDPPWDYLAAMQPQLAANPQDIATFRTALTEGDNRLKQRFLDDEPVERLVRDRARLVDALLKTAWSMHVGEHVRDVALIAVGGYGRGELNLCSDIDIMILLPKSESAPWQGSLEKFLTFMWDIGLEVGHSVRTIDDCQRESAADVSVATTMIEARLLQGPELLFEAMRRALAPERVWPTRDFFEAKVAEQTARHHRYYDTAYNLEPNVKSSPGGLRDIQTIGWVAKRHFGAESLDELVDHGFLTRSELRKLKTAQAFLWKVRFALARADGAPRRPPAVRSSDPARENVRLRRRDLHARGRTVHAALLPHGHGREPAERNAVAAVPRGHSHDSNTPPVPVNARFQIKNDFLEVTGEDVFDRYPSAMLELFVIIEQNSEKEREVEADVGELGAIAVLVTQARPPRSPSTRSSSGHGASNEELERERPKCRSRARACHRVRSSRSPPWNRSRGRR